MNEPLAACLPGSGRGRRFRRRWTWANWTARVDGDGAPRSIYPQAGNVAVLCEGDLVGYEASILQRWADANVGTKPLVDVWPCGTKNAIFGMSDSLGRSRPILVIEDRDFRSQDEASADGLKQAKDRGRRGVRVLDWRTWRRNEVENYFIQPSVLVPVMSDAFNCSADDVRDAVTEVVRALPVYQALQYAIYQCRRAWEPTDPSRHLQSKIESRPKIEDASRLVAPKVEVVRKGLQENSGDWSRIFVENAMLREPFSGEPLIVDFDSKYDEWRSLTWTDVPCQLDWSGRREQVFEKKNRANRDRADREIEAALRPLLVSRLLAQIDDDTGELESEWAEIRKAMLSWQGGESV